MNALPPACEGGRASATIMGKNISEETWEFAREQCRSAIQNFYDDPIGVSGDDDAVVVGEAYDFYRRLADDLDVDFDDVLSSEVSGYEKRRVDSLRNGEGDIEP